MKYIYYTLLACAGCSILVYSLTKSYYSKKLVTPLGASAEKVECLLIQDFKDLSLECSR